MAHSPFGFASPEQIVFTSAPVLLYTFAVIFPPSDILHCNVVFSPLSGLITFFNTVTLRASLVFPVKVPSLFPVIPQKSVPETVMDSKSPGFDFEYIMTNDFPDSSDAEAVKSRHLDVLHMELPQHTSTEGGSGRTQEASMSISILDVVLSE